MRKETPSLCSQAFLVRVSRDVPDRGDELRRIVDEHFPASFAPRSWQAASLSEVTVQRMNCSSGEGSRRVSFEVSGNRRDLAVMLQNCQMGVIMPDAARDAAIVGVFAGDCESLGDCDSLGIVKSYGWIF